MLAFTFDSAQVPHCSHSRSHSVQLRFRIAHSRIHVRFSSGSALLAFTFDSAQVPHCSHSRSIQLRFRIARSRIHIRFSSGSALLAFTFGGTFTVAFTFDSAQVPHCSHSHSEAQSHSAQHRFSIQQVHIHSTVTSTGVHRQRSQIRVSLSRFRQNRRSSQSHSASGLHPQAHSAKTAAHYGKCLSRNKPTRYVFVGHKERQHGSHYAQ